MLLIKLVHCVCLWMCTSVHIFCVFYVIHLCICFISICSFSSINLKYSPPIMPFIALVMYFSYKHFSKQNLTHIFTYHTYISFTRIRMKKKEKKRYNIIDIFITCFFMWCFYISFILQIHRFLLLLLILHICCCRSVITWVVMLCDVM